MQQKDIHTSLGEMDPNTKLNSQHQLLPRSLDMHQSGKHAWISGGNLVLQM
jgi:hypothetical protein